jgi:hypothetical protein
MISKHCQGLDVSILEVSHLVLNLDYVCDLVEIVSISWQSSYDDLV